MTVQNNMKIVSNVDYQQALVEYKHLVKHPKALVTRLLEGKELEEYIKRVDKNGLSFLQECAFRGAFLGSYSPVIFDTSHHCSFKFVGSRFYLPHLKNAKVDDHLNLLYSIFHEYAHLPQRETIHSGSKDVFRSWFHTYSSVAFHTVAKQLYSIDQEGNPMKMLPKNVEEWLNPLVLAFWYMTDGVNSRFDPFPNIGDGLPVSGFSEDEILELRKVLFYVYGIKTYVECEMYCYEYYIRIADRSMWRFHELLEPFSLAIREFERVEKRLEEIKREKEREEEDT